MELVPAQVPRPGLPWLEASPLNDAPSWIAQPPSVPEKSNCTPA